MTVLNVVTPLDASMSESGLIGADEDREAEACEHADSVIESAQRRAVAVDRSVEPAIETGDPAETIVNYVTAHEVDHVIMGGHGGDRSELARQLLGTMATAVVSDAQATVTVVR